MSEYRYYYFESADKPLTAARQKELRHAEIDSRHFVNEYRYGNLKAEPLKLMKKYFDVHLYYANWGTGRGDPGIRVALRRPIYRCLYLAWPAQYCEEDTEKTKILRDLLLKKTADDNPTKPAEPVL
jgi:hypothetical protein